MLMRPARHQRAGPRRPLGQRLAALREATRLDDWRQVGVLRIAVPLILAAVSFYYLVRWAHANAMPPELAWTLPAALDVTAYKAVKVALHPISRAAKRKASALAWLCVALSVAGNIGSHALDALGQDGKPLLQVSFATIALTAMVYPLMLVAGHIVAGGMAPRPLTAAQQAAAEAERVRAETELAALRDEARLAQAARRRAIAEQAPASGARATERATPAERPATPATAPAGDTAGDGGDQRVSEDRLWELAVAYMRANEGAGRRALLNHLREETGLGPALKEYVVKGRPGFPGLHERAKEAAAAETPAPVAQLAEEEPADEREPVGAAAAA